MSVLHLKVIDSFLVNLSSIYHHPLGMYACDFCLIVTMFPYCNNNSSDTRDGHAIFICTTCIVRPFLSLWKGHQRHFSRMGSEPNNLWLCKGHFPSTRLPNVGGKNGHCQCTVKSYTVQWLENVWNCDISNGWMKKKKRRYSTMDYENVDVYLIMKIVWVCVHAVYVDLNVCSSLINHVCDVKFSFLIFTVMWNCSNNFVLGLLSSVLQS